MTLRRYYQEYKSEFFFGILLLAAVVASYYFSQFIPTQLYLNVISPFQRTALLVICGIGAWSLMKHSEGLRVRRVSAYAMIAWTVLLTINMLFEIINYGEPDNPEGFLSPSNWEFVLGDVLGWLLMVYLTEALRPGWLNFWRACVQLVPVLVVGTVDAFLPNVDLRWLLAAYPFVLLVMIGSYVRDYHKYIEDNYGSMENIDVQWIVRFMKAEGYDILPAAATAVCSVSKALEEGKITKDDYVMLNVTGGGLIEAKKGGYVEKEPDLVLDPDLPAEEITKQVKKLFKKLR